MKVATVIYGENPSDNHPPLHGFTFSSQLKWTSHICAPSYPYPIVDTKKCMNSIYQIPRSPKFEGTSCHAGFIVSTLEPRV